MADIQLIRGSNGNGPAVRPVVTAARSSGSLTLKVNSTTNLPTNFIGTWGKLNQDTGKLISSSIRDFYGQLNGADIDLVRMADGFTDDGNEIGDVIVLKPNTDWTHNLADTLLVSHNPDGTSAANSVNRQAIEDGAVGTAQIENGAVGTAQIENGAVGTAKLSPSVSVVSGWTVYDMGSFKIYKKALNVNTGSMAGSAYSTYNLSTPPTGLSIDLDYTVSWTVGANPHWFTLNPTKTATHIALNVYNRAGSTGNPNVRASILVVA